MNHSASRCVNDDHAPHRRLIAGVLAGALSLLAPTDANETFHSIGMKYFHCTIRVDSTLSMPLFKGSLLTGHKAKMASKKPRQTTGHKALCPVVAIHSPGAYLAASRTLPGSPRSVVAARAQTTSSPDKVFAESMYCLRESEKLVIRRCFPFL